MRIEQDFLGKVEVPKDALYGVHSLRAVENFPDSTPFHKEWYQAVGQVKLACYRTYEKFIKAKETKYPKKQFLLPEITEASLQVLKDAAIEIMAGKYFSHFIVPAIQGGAGTSINLNVNEIIANRAITLLGGTPGDYNLIDPFEHANVFQSTNDVIPTSLKVASIALLENLETSINQLRDAVEKKEGEFRQTARIAYTQMQEAVPSSYGMLFSAYSESLSRDWWRVSKCFERLKVVNLGGGAIGTGISIPRFFIMEVVSELQQICKLPISRSENLTEATSNLDAFVEVHAILKAHAVNLEKMVNDIRLLASDITGAEVAIPQKQVGSSIMPGKVNPVIPEFVIAAVHKIYANDQIITSLSAQGCLDLNANIPLIGHALLESIKLLIACDKTLLSNLMTDLQIKQGISEKRFRHSASVTTALSPYIGYHQAAKMAKLMKETNIDVVEANKELKLIDDQKLLELLKLDNLLKLGFTLNDLTD